MNSETRTEAGRTLLEWTQQHFRDVHGTAHPELPEQFRAIEDESWNAALREVEEAAASWRAAVKTERSSRSMPFIPFADLFDLLASLRKPVTP